MFFVFKHSLTRFGRLLPFEGRQRALVMLLINVDKASVCENANRRYEIFQLCFNLYVFLFTLNMLEGCSGTI